MLEAKLAQIAAGQARNTWLLAAAIGLAALTLAITLLK
jgi:hypothetical protein